MRRFIQAISLLMATTSAVAQSPLWMRNPAISPDGTTVAFTYGGDIFTVPVNGGEARLLTSSANHDTWPVWSPDGKTIVFASDREGSLDLYAMDAAGGVPRRLTTTSGTETPLAFIDDTHVIYSTGEIGSETSSRMPTRLTRTYCVDISATDPRPSLFLSMPMLAASANSNGDILYQDRKGLENTFRKHERSSATSDIWKYSEGKFIKLTDFNGHDLSPVWAPNGTDYYYLSEETGTINVFANINGTPRAITNFEKHPVRSLSIASDGTLAFSWDGELYTLRPDQEPRKLPVEIKADQYKSDRIKSFENSGASNMAVSPDGKEVALVIRGDIYVTDAEYKTTRRITNTPAQERMVSFSPDGRSLVYDSDSDGVWQLFTATIKNPTEKRFTYAGEIVETPLYSSTKPSQCPIYSPDGKKVAFFEDRTTLQVIDLDTKKVTTALDGKYNYSYTDGDMWMEWSPDSRWLLTSYIGTGGWNNIDVAAVKADGTQVVNLTESGFSDENAKWAMDGKAVTYETSRYGMKNPGSWGNQSDIIFMALDADTWDDFNATEEEVKLKEAATKDDSGDGDDDKKDKADKKSKKSKKDKKDEVSTPPFEPDFAGRTHRTRRITAVSSMTGDYILSPKGDKLYYTARGVDGKSALYEHDLRKGGTKVLISGFSGGLATDTKGENIFALSGGNIKKVDVAAGTTKDVPFDAPYDRLSSLEREYIYNHMLHQVADKFYDENLHGVDWDYYGEHYRRFLPYINNNYDMAEMMSEILGELNASHTGASYYGPGASLGIASLGAFYDCNYQGDGLKISEVINGSPLSAPSAHIAAGDIILNIDGDPIEAGHNWYSTLEGKAGRKVRLEVEHPTGKRDTVHVRAISQGTLNDLLYKRWVAHNEAVVDSLSGGKIGYVHVQGMDSKSFADVYSRLLGKYRNADAVVVDTRWNGGGWLHNDLALLLNGRHYVDFKPRGRYIGSEPFSQWSKPSVMLVNEGNYSDAHGSPYTYKTLGIGKLVGAPVAGTMTAVWWETQIDPSIVFGIPQVTNADLQGNPLENCQLNPDIIIYNDPADELRGHDAQLEAAVRALQGNSN